MHLKRKRRSIEDFPIPDGKRSKPFHPFPWREHVEIKFPTKAEEKREEKRQAKLNIKPKPYKRALSLRDEDSLADLMADMELCPPMFMKTVADNQLRDVLNSLLGGGGGGPSTSSRKRTTSMRQ